LCGFSEDSAVLFLCRKLAEEELKMNVADQDVFTFPSESELKEPLGLQEVQRRIRDVVAVLSDFNKLRDKDRYAVFPTECFRLTVH
jgi:hypothetical protein